MTKLGRLTLICASLLFGLLLSELLLRVLPLGSLEIVPSFRSPPWESWADPRWANPPGSVYVNEPTLGYEYAPNVSVLVPVAEHPRNAFRFRTNNLGLRRDADTAPEKSAGTFRVLVLGDSHTSGYVDNRETFAALLEERLAGRLASGGQAVEVLNAGIVGYSPAQAFLWYRIHGKALDPDVILLVFYTGNDVMELDNPFKPGIDVANGRAIPASTATAPGESGPGRFVEPGTRRVRIFALARRAVTVGPLAPLWQRLRLPGRQTEASGFDMDALTQVLGTCPGCFWQSLQQRVYAAREPERSRENMLRTADILRLFDREARDSGHRFVVAMLATRAQVEPERARHELELAAKRLRVEAKLEPFEDEVNAALQSELQLSGVQSISLLEGLRSAAGKAPQYYSHDWHLNGDGHRTVAAVLERELASRGLIGSSDR